jgi:hypothetical protein
MGEVVVPVAFTTKLWSMGRKGLIIRLPKGVRERAGEWRGERIYVVIIPEKALQHHEVILKAKVQGGQNGIMPRN